MVRIVLVVLALLASACAPLGSPQTPAPSPPPITLVPIPPTSTLAPSATPLPAAPVVRDRFSLRKLPGIGRRPSAIAAMGDVIYVANQGTDNLAVIQDDRVVRFVQVGKRPTALAADVENKRVYVANSGDKTLSLISEDRVQLTVSIGEEASALVFFGDRLYAGLYRGATLLVLDPATLQVQTRIVLPNASSIINMAVDPIHDRIIVDLYEKLVVLGGRDHKVLATHVTKGSYYTIASDSLQDRLLVAIYEPSTRSQFLVALDPLSGVERGRAKIDGDPRGAVISPDGRTAFVVNSFGNTVSVVDLSTMTTRISIPVGREPGALALDGTGRRLYVANAGSDSVHQVDTDAARVAATIPLAMAPTAFATDEATNRVYIANASTDSVFIVEGARVVKEVGVGRHPIDLSRDNQSNRLYVANRADGTLSIVDERDLSVVATKSITRTLTTVAVDQAHSRLFAGDVILDLNTLSPVGSLLMHGYMLGSAITPDLVRLGPNPNRIYAIAWNGTPGSNSRTILYSLDGAMLSQRMLTGYGSLSALEIDAERDRVIVAESHPLAYTNTLIVYDADEKKVVSLPLRGLTFGIAYNPKTRHVFLSHSTGYGQGYGPTPVPSENLVEILDGDSFGVVAYLTVDSPGKMARLGDTIYVASRADGSITTIKDASVPTPPSPTPTRTPTPWPSSTPTIAAKAVSATPTLDAARRLTVPAPCSIPIPSFSGPRWTPALQNRVGCSIEAQRLVRFATQPFERGTMFWREDDKRIHVLFGDKTWLVFDDTWSDSRPEDSCPGITVSSGLIKPKRGFGKLWCDQPQVRAKLGAATGAELGLYEAPVQRLERGIIVGNQLGQPIVLFSDSHWEVYP